MKELRVDIGGSNRGFQMATEDTKRIARDLQRSLDTYTPETFKNASVLKEKFGSIMDEAAPKVGGFMNGIKSGLSSIRQQLGGGLATAGAAVVGAEAIRRTIEFGSQVNDLSERLGISTDAVQKWGYALSMTGSDMSALTPFFSKLAQARDKVFSGKEGADEMAANFRRLGVSIDDLKNKRLEDIGMKIADSVKGQDVQQIIGTLKEVGGKGATEFVAAFKEGMAGLGDEAANAGAIMSKEAIERMDAIGDKATQLGLTIKAGMAYILTPIIDTILSIVSGIQRAAAFAGGFSAGGLNGGLQALKDFDKNKEIEDAKAKERGKNRASAYKADGKDEMGGSEKSQEKSKKEAFSKARELAEAQNSYREAVENSVIKSEKLKMLKEDELALEHALIQARQNGDKKSEYEIATKLLGKRKESKDTEKDMLVKKETGHVDSLSSMGLISSAGAMTNPVLDVNRKQLTQLQHKMSLWLLVFTHLVAH
jgi:hypothetical protein